MRLRSIVVTTLLSIVLLLVTVTVFLWLTLPQRLKPLLEENLSLLIKRPVTIQEVSVIPFSGVALTGIRVYSLDAPEERLIATVASITIKPHLSSLLKGKALNVGVSVRGFSQGGLEAGGTLRLYFSHKNGKFPLEKVTIDSAGIEDPAIGRLFKDIRATFTFTGALINVDIASQLLRIQGRCEITAPGVITIRAFELITGSSAVSLNGELRTVGDPSYDIRGSSRITTSDILILFPGLIRNPERLGIGGSFEINGIRMSGTLSKPGNASLDMELSSRLLTIYGQKIEDINGLVRFRDGIGSLRNLSGRVYDGQVACECECDTKNRALPFRLVLAFGNVDFSRVIQNTGLKGKGISGVGEGWLELAGLSRDTATYEGALFFHVKDGNLGPLPIFSSVISSVTFVLQHALPGYKREILTESAGDFAIRDRRITTHNLTAWGQTTTVQAAGYIDFDGVINLTVENGFTQPSLSENGQWADSIQGIISSAGGVISRGALTGTLKKPEYTSTSTTNFSRFLDQAASLVKDML